MQVPPLRAAKEEVVKAKQTISDLQSALQTTRNDAEKFMVGHESNIVLHRENSDLRSAFTTLQEKVTEAEQKLMPGIDAFKDWMAKNSIRPDTPILGVDLTGYSGDVYHVFAHNALVGVHSKNWNSAHEDAKKVILGLFHVFTLAQLHVKSIDVRPSAIGHIAQALSQIGKGEMDEALEAFDLVYGNCSPNEGNLLLVIKAIILFVAGRCDEAISRIRNLISVLREDEMLYSSIQILGKMYLMNDDYASAVQSLERAQGPTSSRNGSDLETISLIFGWTFDGLRISAQQYHCENLYVSGRVEEATRALLNMLDTLDGETHSSKTMRDWVTGFKSKCVDTLSVLGDTAFSSRLHEDAVARYTSALSLGPSDPVDILVKRSKARASIKLWQDALMDANEVIKRDPSSHLGYERKFAALFGAAEYDEANNALLHMLSIIEKSPDEGIRQLRANYTTQCEAITAIDAVIHEFFRFCPLVLIDITTGRLCDSQERIRIFKSEAPFKKLISEVVVTKIDRKHIWHSVMKYFKWTMFSHTWEGKEPTFQDVNVVDTVWKLDKSPLNEKLQRFCSTARGDGGRWVWSDTCCIDKTTSTILSQSLIAMYMWYAEAAETLVYLADVLSSAKPGALEKSRWMTRAWTLQELLASKVVRFYTSDWKLYLNDTHTNHKDSPMIKQELARAMGVAPETITSFHPKDLGVREKLRLASTRNATVEEDMAYSLIGIFSSDIVPRYGLGNVAVGQLLENIVSQTGNVTVIAWTGKSLPYNSALPDSLSVYSSVPYNPPSMDDSELETRVNRLRIDLEVQDALALYTKVTQLDRATFSNRCLRLPCIAFSVTKIGVQQLGGGSEGTLYRATVSILGKVELRTADVIPLDKPRRLVFVHPWLHDLRDPVDGFVSDDEDERETTSGAISGNSTDDASLPASPADAEPSARGDLQTLALRLIARLQRPFNALLLEQQKNGQYKRIAAENKIIVSGIPPKVNLKDIKPKELEIV